MTVNSTTSRVSYAGNGSTTAFAVPFYFLANADLTVITTSSTGVQTTLVLNTGYTVSGAGNPAGGTVTCTTAPASGESLVIFRAPAETQLTDYQSNDPFPAETHERALDRLTMIAQRLKDLIVRSVTLSDGDTTTASTTLPSPSANKLLGWNPQANGLQNFDQSALFTGIVFSDWQHQTFTGDGLTVSFTLNAAPGALGNIDVSVSGVTQSAISNYSLVGNVLTFTTAPPNGSTVFVRYGSSTPQSSPAYSSELRTATSGQTVFTFTSLTYIPGANNLMVYVNGLRMVGSSDYTETSSTSITFTSGLSSGDEVLAVAGRPISDAVGAENVGYLPAGTGAVTRTAQSKLRDVVSVRDYGATGDGVTNDTAAFVAAIAAVEAINSFGDGNGGGRPTILVPDGLYVVNALTINKRLRLLGAGSSATALKLAAGQTGPLLTINAQDLAGTSIDDSSHALIESMSLIGNRVDSTTTGSSHGIYCPPTAWTITTQYSPSVRVSDLNIFNFTGNGIHLGDNRNWCLADRLIVRYCNDNALATYSYDHRFTACDFGVCKNYGVREYAGGANVFTACNIYFNDINYVSNNTSNSYSTFTSCAFDGAATIGASIAQATGLKSFIGCRFSGNSQNGANTYSDIVVSGASSRASVVGCHFEYSGQTVKHLIETGSSPRVYWVANEFLTTGAVPYGTSVANTPADLILAGDAGWSIGAGGSFGTVSGPMKLPSYTVAGLPSASALNGAQVYVSNESGGAVIAFSDGTNWRRVTDRAIVS